MNLTWARAIPLVLLPLLALLYFTFQRMDNSLVETPAAEQTLPRYTLHGTELNRYDADGALSLSAKADTIAYYDDQSGRAANLQVDLSGDDEDRSWHLTAPAASLPAHQRRFMLEGPVLAGGEWPDNGETLALRTDHLWVDPDRRLIDTDAAVELRSTSRSGTAQGLRSDWDGQAIQLLHNVKMNYQVPAPEPQPRP